MGCACIDIGGLDGDPARVLKDIFSIARKEHKCDECRRTIKIGEEYRYETFVCQGNFEVHKTCKDCNSIRKEMFCDTFYYGCILDEVQEYVQDVKGDVGEDCLVELTVEARAMLCEMIENVWRDDESN